MQLTQATRCIPELFHIGGLNRRLRGVDTAMRLLFPIRDQRDAPVAINYLGLPYLAFPNHYVDYQVLLTGGYEHPDLEVFKRIAERKPNAIAIDIGGNVGHHAFVFAALGWAVHTFEPNPLLWPMIEAKSKHAGFANLNLHKIGLGDRDEELPFYLPDVLNSGTGTFAPLGCDAGPIQGVMPIRRGDDFLLEAGVIRADILKIDIQGFEPFALHGLKNLLQSSRPILCIEVGEENRASFQTLSQFSEYFPNQYRFLYCEYSVSGPFRSHQLRSVSQEEFSTLSCNVFCVPEECSDWVGF